MEHLWKNNWFGNVEVLGKKLILCHFGHGQVYLRFSGREDGPVLQDSGDKELREIWYDCCIYKHREFKIIRNILFSVS